MSLTIGVAGPENGITSLGNGPVNINAGGNLMLLSPVSSQAGDVVLASAGTLDRDQSTVSSTSGRVTVQGIVLQPSLSDCIANPASAGCAAVLPTLSACQSDPAIPRLFGRVAATRGFTADVEHLHRRPVHKRLRRGAADAGSMHQRTHVRGLHGCAADIGSMRQRAQDRGLYGCAAVRGSMHRHTRQPGLHRHTAAGEPEQFQRAQWPKPCEYDDQRHQRQHHQHLRCRPGRSLRQPPPRHQLHTAPGGPSTTDTKTVDAKTTEKKDDTKKDDTKKDDKQSVAKKDEPAPKTFCN